ncbi:MAG TPA: 1-acyl-sn-glycerol-3-phosphate acyltransferase [Bacteroidia bacterium]|nr:glycerol acyltransferase [Sphingobacteriales bacterium]HPD65765.1 1-acyl-sn-glycerol-3-phosphate acyltransferase [Bacteroidia bacterium]HRS59506.1 1-acyl-sn-glycerol-3-phosphate acyltransferase [Bacteroidia bacterium]HRU67602.1 1-acyl-sn-glycerol-3-phosphate acyltransferase [Bacteroidia bacterium]
MEKEPYKFIDVEKVIGSKSEKFLRIVPKFIIRYLKRILHEDEINSALNRNADKKGLDFVNEILIEFGTKIKVVNESNIPRTQKAIVASNHPLGGLDGLALMKVVGKFNPNIRFLVNDLLLNLENLKEIFIPINTLGRTTKETAMLLRKIYESDNLILNFPFGLVSRKRRGRIEDLEWKKSFITKAREYQRDIIPVYIDGKNSNFFYTLANVRKRLGIKLNLEMFLLVNEMYRQCSKLITISFGKPISYKTFDNRYSDADWAEKLRRHVYQMAINPDIDFVV